MNQEIEHEGSQQPARDQILNDVSNSFKTFRMWHVGMASSKHVKTLDP